MAQCLGTGYWEIFLFYISLKSFKSFNFSWQLLLNSWTQKKIVEWPKELKKNILNSCNNLQATWMTVGFSQFRYYSSFQIKFTNIKFVDFFYVVGYSRQRFEKFIPTCTFPIE